VNTGVFYYAKFKQKSDKSLYNNKVIAVIFTIEFTAILFANAC